MSTYSHTRSSVYEKNERTQTYTYILSMKSVRALLLVVHRSRERERPRARVAGGAVVQVGRSAARLRVVRWRGGITNHFECRYIRSSSSS